MNFFERITVLIFLFLVSGCTSNNSVLLNPYKSDLLEDKLLLRGTFNWWGVFESYRLKPLSPNSWYVDVNLVGDGENYDFKLSDENWSPLQTCGNKEQILTLTLTDSLKIYCSLDSMNLRFSPSSDGIYRFILDKKDSIYWLTVSKK